MQGSRNIDILMHIRDYCAEINHTMDTFGRDYDIFVSNSIYQNAVALCVLQIGELTTHFILKNVDRISAGQRIWCRLSIRQN